MAYDRLVRRRGGSRTHGQALTPLAGAHCEDLGGEGPAQARSNQSFEFTSDSVSNRSVLAAVEDGTDCHEETCCVG